jgi:hypothetical protein
LCLLIFDPLAHVASVILSNTRHTPYCPDILIFSSFFGLLCCSFGIVCGGSASAALFFQVFPLSWLCFAAISFLPFIVLVLLFVSGTFKWIGLKFDPLIFIYS